MGVNLEGRAMYRRWLELQAGATIQRSRYDEPEVWSEDETVPGERKLFRTPNVYGYFTASVTPVKRFSAYLSGTYTGKMLVQHIAGVIERDEAVTVRDFFDMEVKLAYDFQLYKEVGLQLSTGVKNVFGAYRIWTGGRIGIRVMSMGLRCPGVFRRG